MNYPEFNSISIISLLISVSSIGLLIFFIKISIGRIKDIENRLGILIKSFNALRNYVTSGSRSNCEKKEEAINYMEGDIDLVKEGKTATFKAIYYPKKIRRK